MNSKRLKLLVLGVVILVLAGAVFAFFSDEASAPDGKETPSDNNPRPGPDSQDQSTLKTNYSIDDPASPWVVVNKKRPLPADYVPEELKIVSGINLAQEAAAAMEEMIDASTAADARLRGISGYRSYDSQKTLYNGYVQRNGREDADTYSARPGYSEHQTGLAADLGNPDGTCDLEICFAETSGGKWLAEHAHEYGFIISYPNGKTPVTGYQYEPWHVRYVGKELAAEIKNTGKTMQEYFGLPAAPGY